MKITGVKKGLKGMMTVPGDKSISHRAVMFGSLAEGTTTIHGFLQSEDCLNTMRNFKRMGVTFEEKGDTLIVQGVGLNGLKKPSKALDVGNSGTSFRLMTGILSGQTFITKLTGDASIQKRPMKRVVEPLKLMGGRFSGVNAPLIIFPGKLKGMTHTMTVPSAQVKSALILAGLYAKGKTTVVEAAPTRDHTERMLKSFGADLAVTLVGKKNKIVLTPGKKLKGQAVEVPGDISSSAFFIIAALIVPGSKITIKNICINPTRTGILDVLLSMGASITLKNKKTLSGEPVADLEVKYSELKGVTIDGDTVVRMIDEVPILSVAAACAKGQTIIKDAEELRVKESDRIKSTVEMLNEFGVTVEEKVDGMIITGKPGFAINKKVKINAYFDHRIAMAAAVMGLLNKKETTISDDSCIATSFPGFLEHLQKIS